VSSARKKTTKEAAKPPVDIIDLAPGIGQIVVFWLKDQKYALPVSDVQEIQQVVEFSEVSGDGEMTVGMMNLRGAIIPVFYARDLLGLTSREYSLDTPMIICKVASALISIIVDDVDDVVALPAGALAPPPALHPLAQRMLGVVSLGEDLVSVLNVETLVHTMRIGPE